MQPSRGLWLERFRTLLISVFSFLFFFGFSTNSVITHLSCDLLDIILVDVLNTKPYKYNQEYNVFVILDQLFLLKMLSD